MVDDVLVVMLFVAIGLFYLALLIEKTLLEKSKNVVRLSNFDLVLLYRIRDLNKRKVYDEPLMLIPEKEYILIQKLASNLLSKRL